MLRGFYTAASGMLAQQRRTDILTNNLANVNTAGYKSQKGIQRAFPDLLMNKYMQSSIPGIKDPTASQIGVYSGATYIQEVYQSYSQGTLQETNTLTDAALLQTSEQGALFFGVLGADNKIAYTRNGNFAVNREGFLTTQEGLYVVNRDGERVRVNKNDFKIRRDGTVFEGNIPTTQLGVFFSANPNELIKQANGTFKPREGVLPSAFTNNDVTFTVEQGMLERSNVDVNELMTELNVAYRNFEANQRVLSMMDRSMEKAVNEIGRLR